MKNSSRLTREQIERLVKGLEHFRTRPQMYLGDFRPEQCRLHFRGIEFGLSAIGVGLGHEHMDRQDAAAQARGWRSIYQGELWEEEMRERGWTNEQIVDEMTVIEIDALKRLAASMTNGAADK